MNDPWNKLREHWKLLSPDDQAKFSDDFDRILQEEIDNEVITAVKSQSDTFPTMSTFVESYMQHPIHPETPIVESVKAPLKTIEQHNAEVTRRHSNKNLLGIECPHCGNEMQRDADFRGIMLSSPAQINIKCYECGYTTRVYTL